MRLVNRCVENAARSCTGWVGVSIGGITGVEGETMRKRRMRYRKYKRPYVTIINHYSIQETEHSEIARHTPSSPEEKEKNGFWRSVWRIIINKESKTGKRTAYVLAEVMSYVFNTIALLGVALFMLFGYSVIFKLNWNVDISKIIVQTVFCLVLLLVTAILSLTFRAIANEIKAERDRNYITNLFFGMVAIVSLVVSVVALFKEAG